MTIYTRMEEWASGCRMFAVTNVMWCVARARDLLVTHREFVEAGSIETVQLAWREMQVAMDLP